MTSKKEMASLNIRNLPEHVHRRLRIRAAEAGRSMEAEARAILTEVCSRRTSPTAVKALQDWVDELYGGGRKPKRVVDTLIRERRREAARE